MACGSELGSHILRNGLTCGKHGHTEQWFLTLTRQYNVGFWKGYLVRHIDTQQAWSHRRVVHWLHHIDSVPQGVVAMQCRC